MTLQPDLVGTITLTSGSPNFTVAGVNLVAADVGEGDQIILPDKGLTLTIGARTSATTGTLTNNCPAAAAGAGQAARIRFQADLSRVAAQTRQLVDLLGNGNVDALAALGLAANKGIYGTGLNTLGLFDLSAFGRARAGDADGAAARAALDVAQRQANVSDITAGRGLVVGAFGLGSLGMTIPGGNYNNAIVAGIYSGAGGAAVNGPGGSTAYGPMAVLNRNNAVLTQIATYGSSSIEMEIYARGSADNGATWGSWRNITPIIGSNANGWYIRFSDGTQKCYYRATVTNQSATAAYGPLFSGSRTWTFPAAFSIAPVVEAAIFRLDTGYSWGGVYQSTAASAAMFVLDVSSRASGVPCEIGFEAVGRWF